MCLSQSFNDYFNTNHSRLLSLWRTAVSFRRQFSDLKATTDDELASLHAEIGRLSRDLHSASLSLSSRHQVSTLDLFFDITDHSSQVLTAHYASTVIAIVSMSVRPSVRLPSHTGTVSK